MAGKFPESYAAPRYDQVDAANEHKLGLPVGLLTSIRTAGEKTNASRTSSAGATTPYQFIPATRDAILDKYGIDVTLSPENASEGAGLLLKESLKRNQGDIETAVREYHGGTDRSNWGKVNNAYAGRVLASHSKAKTQALDSGFGAFMRANPAIPESAPQQAEQSTNDPLAAGFGAFLAKNPQPDTPAEQPKTGLIDGLKEAVTGSKRRTEATEAAPDWADMPELNSFSMASAKSGLGTLLANPQEAAQVIQANFPGVKTRQDEKGNFFLQSSIDGKEYSIKPGFRPSDIPRAVAGVAAFTPAGRATSILGAGAAAGATQAVIEGSQAATGGSFDPKEVALATAMGSAVPAAIRTVQAAKQPLTAAVNRLRNGPPPAPPVPPVPVPVPTPPVVPLPSSELNQTARQAAEGGFGSKSATEVLAEQAAPNAKVVDAAKRLGIQDYLQADHVTTNQAYRELAQAVKSIPGSEARAAELAGLESVAKRADDLVEQIGGTADVSALSADLKKGLQATHDELKTNAGKLYDEVRANVPATSPSSAETVLSMIEARATELGGVKNLSSMEKMIRAKLTPKVIRRMEDVPANPLMLGSQPATKKIVEEIKQPNYALLDDVRRDLTAAKYARQGPFKDSDDRLIGMLEGALREDQQAAAESFGMGATWDLAQKTSSAYKGIQDDLSAIFGKNLDESLVGKLHSAVGLLPKGDTAKFVKLIKSIPEAMRQEVVASGLNTAFGISAKRGQISFASFASWYEGLLRNKQAYTAVMSNLPQPARKQISDLYRVSSGISKASKERIMTGRLNAVVDDLKGPDNLVARLYDTARRSAVGAAVGTAAAPIVGPGAAAAIASTLAKGAKSPAIKSVDALISSKEFIDLAKQGARPSRPARLRLVHSDSFKRFAREVGQSRDPGAAERWINQAMQNNNQR